MVVPKRIVRNRQMCSVFIKHSGINNIGLRVAGLFELFKLAVYYECGLI